MWKKGIRKKGINEIAIDSLRFGKLPPKVDYRTLDFSAYVKDDIPEPPLCLSQTERVTDALHDEIHVLFPMYANDQIGDCTIAAMAHGVTLYNGMVLVRHIPDEKNVIKIYFHLTGGSDTGLYMLDVVKYWREVGIEDHAIYAYVSVHHTNHTHVKQAIDIFGGLFVGFHCQEKVMEEFRDGTPWKPGKYINAGHAIYVTGYDKDGVDLLTWGTFHRGTWSWWNNHVDEAFCLLPPEAREEGFTKDFDFERLKRDLAEVAIL